jgi:outer membrane protein assembly factor BamB
VKDLNAGFTAKKQGGFMGIGGRKPTRPVWSSPLLANNRLILAGQTGDLVALNAKTGEEEKRVRLGSPTLLGPIAAGNTIYVVTDEAQLIALR